MLIKQLSIFVENKAGRLAEITEIIAKAGIDIRALSIADTTNFGILRLIVDKPDEAEKALKDGLSYEAPGGRQYLKPEYHVVVDCQKEIRQLCTLFGLAPSARMRMELSEPERPDELESLLD